VAGVAASVATAGEVNLSQAWQAALGHDPAFAAARAQWDAGRTQEQQARALWLPALSANASAGRGALDSHTRGAAFSAPGFGSTTGVDFQSSITGGTATRWSVLAEQPLFDAARIAGARELKAGARLAAEQYRARPARADPAHRAQLFRRAQRRRAGRDARAPAQQAERSRAEAQAATTPATFRSPTCARRRRWPIRSACSSWMRAMRSRWRRRRSPTSPA
jgi:outer membrane protein